MVIFVRLFSILLSTVDESCWTKFNQILLLEDGYLWLTLTCIKTNNYHRVSLLYTKNTKAIPVLVVGGGGKMFMFARICHRRGKASWLVSLTHHKSLCRLGHRHAHSVY